MKNKFAKLSVGYELNPMFKRTKLTKALTLKEELRQPRKVNQGDLDRFGVSLKEVDTELINGVIKGKYSPEILPTSNHNRRILQACYWIANNNLFKTRETLKELGFRNKFIKAFIDDEISLQKLHPEEFSQFIGKPMPKEFELKELN
tara:strand:+ start:844 stop:1284 length:441 start_codon:yes stop_codon:yes gene_type:complete